MTNDNTIPVERAPYYGLIDLVVANAQGMFCATQFLMTADNVKTLRQKARERGWLIENATGIFTLTEATTAAAAIEWAEATAVEDYPGDKPGDEAPPKGYYRLYLSGTSYGSQGGKNGLFVDVPNTDELRAQLRAQEILK